ALEIQRALAGHDWPAGAPVRVRIGIHTGNAVPAEGLYTGLAVHRAARICAAARGGQVLVSQATQTIIEDEEEEPGFTLLDLGERALKDLDRPVRLFQLAAPGLDTRAPPVGHRAGGPTHHVPVAPAAAEPGAFAAAVTRALPRDIASFTGRQAELAQLIGTLAATAAGGEVAGLCAIDGMAGIGKTTFAVHAAHHLAGTFPDGQFFLPLHAHTPGQRPVDPADALASLLLTAGLAPQQIPPGLEARAARWRDQVAGKKILLLLDDAAGHEQVRPLLPGTAGSLVLVTSRRRLTALEDAAVISLDTLPPGEAAALLARLAARRELRARDAAVGEITSLCGNLPLAIGMLDALYSADSVDSSEIAGVRSRSHAAPITILRDESAASRRRPPARQAGRRAFCHRRIDYALRSELRRASVATSHLVAKDRGPRSGRKGPSGRHSASQLPHGGASGRSSDCPGAGPAAGVRQAARRTRARFHLGRGRRDQSRSGRP
ncbi:MAG TPA: NB-ARC domain-containing protein, partial [Streptosporangiaceae bacterium]